MSSNSLPIDLVTGGAGFIGSHLVEHLLSAGREVWVVDDLSTGRESNLDHARRLGADRIHFVHSDLEEWLDAEGRSRSFDHVYHLAAAVGVKLVVEDPIGTIETNIHQTSAILRFVQDTSTPMLMASTSEVYGKGVRDRFCEDDDLLLGPTSRSRWSYACSKAIDEYLALAHHAQLGIPISIARFFNTVGPRQVGDYGMVLPRFVERALSDEPIEVFGDGTQSRCFCDVRDVVQVLPKMLLSDECTGQVMNVGNDSPITINDLALLVRSVLGSHSKLVHVPYEEAYSPGFEDLQARVPNLDRIQNALGFTPTIQLEQTIRDLAIELQRIGGVR
jgi:UDP-glucose 4-epimerase